MCFPNNVFLLRLMWMGNCTTKKRSQAARRQLQERYTQRVTPPGIPDSAYSRKNISNVHHATVRGYA